MNDRNYGLDLYRIFCCLGVLTYHIMDDLIDTPYETVSKPIYFAASFCVPGFFLLSGYLCGIREELSKEYIESKIITIMKKLFGWIIFWSVIKYIHTKELLDIWWNLTAGMLSDGILPVAWFLFTYCFLMLLAYPLWNIYKMRPIAFFVFSSVYCLFLAFHIGDNLLKVYSQSLWLHLYLGYFCIGMSMNTIQCKMQNRRACIVLFFLHVLSILIYAFEVYHSEIYLLPHNYYGSYFYSVWLITGFSLCLLIPIQLPFLNKMFKHMSKNTFVVYLGHLPILQYFTSLRPIKNTLEGVFLIIIYFIGLELLAECFKKLPLLRKLV